MRGDATPDAWLRFLPHGWSTVPVAVGLALFVVAYLRLGPPASLRIAASKAKLKLPESRWYGETYLKKFVREVGRAAYRRQLQWDIGFLIVLGLGLTVVLDGTLGWSLRSPRELMWLLLVPGAAAAADLLEDILLLIVIRKGEPDEWPPSGGIVKVAAGATVAKLALSLAALLLILVGCIALALGGPSSWPATSFTPLVVGSVAALVFHLVVTLKPWPELISVLIRAGAAIAIVVVGAEWYLSLVDRPVSGSVYEPLGIDGSVRALWAGVRWGGPPALAIVAVLFVMWLIPAGRAKLRDPRFAELDGRGVALKVIAILIGTIALEEILFRGLLFAAWGGESRIALAVAASSVTFGLWHIGPAIRRDRERLRDEKATDPTAPREPENDRLTAAVVTTVFATAIAGVAFCLLRVWSDGIWAPALVHWTANSVGVVFSRLSEKRR